MNDLKNKIEKFLKTISKLYRTNMLNTELGIVQYARTILKKITVKRWSYDYFKFVFNCG